MSASQLPAHEKLATLALDLARAGKAVYADVRLVALARESVQVRDRRVERVSHSDQLGISVRVLQDGAWGFAATWQLDEGSVRKATARALAGAKAGADLRKRLGAPPIELVAAPAIKGTWVTPHTIDPFSVPIADKAELLLKATAAALAVKGVGHADASITAAREDKLLFTSDGTRVHQIALRIAPDLGATAVDRRRGRFAGREHEAPPLQIGWEYITELELADAAPKIAAEALQKLHAPTVEPGLRHVVLAPSNL
ncbi:MAG TPA: DNA gyrase modulator, partial [Nannocystaceae bacterium]|nr:DNA gyrase modulator [Nannocystaceae bacterium]